MVATRFCFLALVVAASGCIERSPYEGTSGGLFGIGKGDCEAIGISLVNGGRVMTIDGVASDWEGLNAAIHDTAGDAAGDASLPQTNNDIEWVYLAKDDATLYARLDLASGASFSKNYRNGSDSGGDRGSYRIGLYNDGPYSDIYARIAWNGSVWEVLADAPQSSITNPTLTGAIAAASGGFMEISIPRASLGNPSRLTRVDAQVSDCCPHTRSLDETSCVVAPFN